MALNTFRDGDSITSVGSPSQCLTTPYEMFFLISILNLLWHILRPLPLIGSLSWEKCSWRTYIISFCAEIKVFPFACVCFSLMKQLLAYPQPREGYRKCAAPHSVWAINVVGCTMCVAAGLDSCSSECKAKLNCGDAEPNMRVCQQTWSHRPSIVALSSKVPRELLISYTMPVQLCLWPATIPVLCVAWSGVQQSGGRSETGCWWQTSLFFT